MTAIVGMATDDGVWIGGDSMVSFSDNRYLANRAMEKVFRCGDDMLIGHTGAVRSAQILAHRFVCPTREPGQEVERYLSGPFVDALHTAHAATGWLKAADGHVERLPDGAALLIGYDGRLFTMYEDFSWCENSLRYEAVGSGRAFALGALTALFALDGIKLLPEEALYYALRAARQHDQTVGGDLLVRKL